MCSFETTWSRSSLLWWVTSEPGTYSAILVKLLTLAWNAEVCWSIVRISKTHQYVQNNQAPHPADSLQLVWFSKSWLFQEKRLVGPTDWDRFATNSGSMARWLLLPPLPNSPTCQQAYITFGVSVTTPSMLWIKNCYVSPNIMTKIRYHFSRFGHIWWILTKNTSLHSRSDVVFRIIVVFLLHNLSIHCV